MIELRHSIFYRKKGSGEEVKRVGSKLWRGATVIACHLPIDRIHSNRARYLEVILDEYLSHVAVKVHQLDCAPACIGEVDVVINPINRQPVGGDHLVLADHYLFRAFINGGPASTITTMFHDKVCGWVCVS